MSKKTTETKATKSPFAKPRRGSKAFAEEKASFIEATTQLLEKADKFDTQAEAEQPEPLTAEQAKMVEGLTEKAPGIWVANESVTGSAIEGDQIFTPAPETLATESETDQAKAEREYGEAALNDLLATPGFLATFRSTSGLEPAVAEAMFRRLTKGTAKPIVTKSTFKATEGGVGPTKRVWEIAAEMKGCRRSEVLDRCLAEGIGINTAKTQYQKFMEAGKGKITGAKKA